MTFQVNHQPVAAALEHQPAGRAAPAALESRRPSLSRPDDARDLGQVKGLGRSLFGDYLWGVELAGTLLLVATIGAILIALRRKEEPA